MTSFSIYTPAYNAAITLPDVIRRIPVSAWPRCERFVIVDDGSTDATASVIDELAAAHPVIQRISLETNAGYGDAVRAGIRALLDCSSDYLVCLHADGQYPPELMEAFVDHTQAHDLDILQGSRHRDGTALQGGTPMYKVVAGKMLCWIENAAFGMQLTDYHSGYLVIHRRVFDELDVDDFSGYFDFDLELIAAARQRGLKIDELAIPTRYADEVSHLNPIWYGIRSLGVVAKYLMGRYKA